MVISYEKRLSGDMSYSIEMLMFKQDDLYLDNSKIPHKIMKTWKLEYKNKLNSKWSSGES
jgi:hypothetical protein